MREESSRTVVDGLREGFADSGIFSEHLVNPEVETRIYRRDTLVIVPRHNRKSVTLADTIAYDHVGLQEGSSLQHKLVVKAARAEFDLRIRVKALSFDGVRRMVEAGLGLAVLPEGAVTPYMGTGMFEAIALDEPWAERALLLGFRDLKSLPVVARAD